MITPSSVPGRRTLRLLLPTLALALATAAAAVAADCPCPPAAPPPPPLWTGSLGFSYLATSGNTDSSSLGLTGTAARQPTPWGLEVSALANRAESDGEETAERLFGSFKARRAVGEAFELFGGLIWERDRFAGFDSRALVSLGGTWKPLRGPAHELSFDGGLTWTEEDPVVGDDDGYAGALLGGTWVWHFTATASLREKALFFPSFSDSTNWRATSDTALEAALASAWALRVGYFYSRDNLPAAGFGKSDATTSVSLVWKR